MRRHDIENWALGIIDRVKVRQPIEDFRVELKARWVDDVKKAARRIAAHANAAHGEPILWLIGVDEEAGTIPGVDFTEFASWYSGVRAAFDELAPEPVSINIPVDGVTVAALFFETDRAPYVVKNSEGGTIQREVPWREATGVRSATRSQLLRLLSPLQKLPDLEIAACLVDVSSWKSQGEQEYLNWKSYLALFLTQPATQETVFPSHRCSFSYSVPDYEPWAASGGEIQFYGSGAKNINATDSFVSIRGSGLFEARANHSFQVEQAEEKVRDGSMFSRGVRVDITLWHAEAERSITMTVELPRQTRGDNKTRRWIKGSYSFSRYPAR